MIACLASCGAGRGAAQVRGAAALSPEAHAFADTVERRAFDFFWERSDSITGLTPDRWPTKSFASVAAMGFALTAYPIGGERGWVTREAAAARTLATLRFLWTARQDSAASGATGYRGFYYHFLRPEDGARFEKVELSSVDTALLMAGVLFAGEYFAGGTPDEREIRTLADSLYRRVDWTWLRVRPPLVSHGWSPEEGFLPYDWGGYNEAMLLYVLALGSPTHPVGAEAWAGYTRHYRWGEFEGQKHVNFSPMFGHQYSHCWIDFRGIRDAFMRSHGLDYFENSRRATLSQRAYAIRNPGGFAGYGPEIWGLSACDGPLDDTLTIAGRRRAFRTYAARGASLLDIVDDGTIAPTAAGGSVAFTPQLSLAALTEMKRRYGDAIWGRYGFLDAFNPTLTVPVEVHHGRLHPRLGWFDTDWLGIDQGPILVMLENQRSGLVWETMRRNPYLRRGLAAAGFRGGWLDAPAPARP
ncbi:MAG: Tat pathway signal protein [Candidatus Eisenbacteria bacterium]|nr:Tat pathway signal protein [Candidatus Eisenbacteria bacterium]